MRPRSDKAFITGVLDNERDWTQHILFVAVRWQCFGTLSNKQVPHIHFLLVEAPKDFNNSDNAFDEVYWEAMGLPELQRHWIPLLTVNAIKWTWLIPLGPGKTIEFLPEIFSGNPLEDAWKEIFHRDGLRLKRDLP